MFISRSAPERASREKRLQPVIHSEMLRYVMAEGTSEEVLRSSEYGRMTVSWYGSTLLKAGVSKLRRRIALPKLAGK